MGLKNNLNAMSNTVSEALRGSNIPKRTAKNYKRELQEVNIKIDGIADCKLPEIIIKYSQRFDRIQLTEVKFVGVTEEKSYIGQCQVSANIY